MPQPFKPVVKLQFNPKQGIIICHGEIIGPKIDLSIKMAVDTGATYTMISLEAAISAGCHPNMSRRKIEITTGSSVEYVPLVTLPEFRAFGKKIKKFDVICHNLPSPSPVEGLLGLNFLNQSGLLIDFSRHIISAS